MKGTRTGYLGRMGEGLIRAAGLRPPMMSVGIITFPHSHAHTHATPYTGPQTGGDTGNSRSAVPPSPADSPLAITTAQVRFGDATGSILARRTTICSPNFPGQRLAPLDPRSTSQHKLSFTSPGKTTPPRHLVQTSFAQQLVSREVQDSIPTAMPTR